MQISGLQKITLVDFPGVIAATVFTRGCSFRCPFCHNPELVVPEQFSPIMPTDEILEFIKSRQGKLGGICITGGEPLLHSDINGFISQIKNYGLKVKLDTNGSFPEKLNELISEGNLDYIAMDIKTTLEKYSSVVNPKSENRNSKNDKLQINVKKSIDLIMNSGVDYEFRTTVCHPLHEVSDFEGIGKIIKGAKRYYIQNFVASKHVDSHTKFKPFSDTELDKALNIMKKYIINTEIR